MQQLKKIILKRKDYTFALLDALLFYYYIVLSLQTEVCCKFVDFYYNQFLISNGTTVIKKNEYITNMITEKKTKNKNIYNKTTNTQT